MLDVIVSEFGEGGNYERCQIQEQSKNHLVLVFLSCLFVFFVVPRFDLFLHYSNEEIESTTKGTKKHEKKAMKS